MAMAAVPEMGSFAARPNAAEQSARCGPWYRRKAASASKDGTHAGHAPLLVLEAGASAEASPSGANCTTTSPDTAPRAAGEWDESPPPLP